MYTFELALGIIVLSGFFSLIVSESRRLSSITAITGVWIGSFLTIPSLLASLSGAIPLQHKLPWAIPGGSFYVAFDGLSAFFAFPVIILSPLAALFGYSYLSNEKKHPGPVWFFYNILVASMLLLVIARNGMLFLVAWEIMSVSSFFLVMFDHEHARVREAGWTYFVATHLGTASILMFFAVLCANAGSLDFEKILSAELPGAHIGFLFVLAVIGFGTKAGFVPFHVWLPEAHPAAPAHVSAVMSGVMIKMGIYGLLRSLLLLGPPPVYWGWTLISIGVVSGITGAVFAVVQRDLKRLLAYCSVENIGIITIGIGTGFLGLSLNMPALVILGFGGGILHVLNHALFKGLLFLGSGAVFHVTETRNIDQLGGLLKRMPFTGYAFSAGAVAISGLPPFNGFVSEMLIYIAGFEATMSGTPKTVLISTVIITGIALIGGLAATALTKSFGIAFLGEPRSENAKMAHEVPVAMRLPMIILVLFCLGIGLAAKWVFSLLYPAIQILAGSMVTLTRETPDRTIGMISNISVVFCALILLTVFLVILRRSVSGSAREETVGTWDCGYACYDTRMQYTASSFTQPFETLFKVVLGIRITGKKIDGYFPKHASYASHIPGVVNIYFFKPLFGLLKRSTGPVKMLQNGRIHLYVLYIFITLVVLMIWKVGFAQ